MKIIDLLKSNLPNQYVDTLEGKMDSGESGKAVISSEPFISNYESYYKQLSDEADSINKRLSYAAKCEKKRKREEKREADYNRAIELYDSGKFDDAMKAFDDLCEYKESASYSRKCWDELWKKKQKEEAERREAREKQEAEERKALEEARRREEEKQRKKNRTKMLFATIAAVLAIGGIIAFTFIRNAGYAVKNIKMSAVSKNNIQYQNDNCVVEILINIDNQTEHSISGIQGFLTIEDINKNVLASGNTNINTGRLPAKSNSKSTLSLRVFDDNAGKIWYSDLDQLTIVFSIDSVQFENTNKKEKVDLTLCKATKELIINEEQNQDEHKQEDEWVYDMYNSLERLAGSDAILPDDLEIFSYSDNETIEHKSNSYKCFFADIHVPDSQVGSYTDNFRMKLENDGFESLNDNCYQKNSTVIYFTEPEWFEEGYSLGYYAFLDQ